MSQLSPEEWYWMSIVMGICVIPAIIIVVLFLLNIQNLLKAISPVNRKVAPGQVWLIFIPLFNIVWQFILVDRIAESIEAEYAMRGLPMERKPTYNLGLAYCILGLLTWFPLVFLAQLIVGILYWVKTAEFRRNITAMPPYTDQESAIFNNL